MSEEPQRMKLDVLKDISEGDTYNFIRSCIIGRSDIVVRLLGERRVDPSAARHLGLHAACKNGYFDIVDMLLSTGKVDVTSRRNYCIRWSCRNGYLDIVTLLLKQPTTDAGDVSNYALSWACENGHANIVSLLIQNKNVDPATEDNLPFTVAAEYGHLNIIKVLCCESRVSVKSDNYCAFRFAVMGGHVEVVKFLITQMGIPPNVCKNYGLRVACITGNIAMAKLFLNHSTTDTKEEIRVNPAVNNNDCLIKACDSGYTEIVKMLLQTEKVDAYADGDMPLEVASEKGHMHIVEMLLAGKRVHTNTRKSLTDNNITQMLLDSVCEQLVSNEVGSYIDNQEDSSSGESFKKMDIDVNSEHNKNTPTTPMSPDDHEDVPAILLQLRKLKKKDENKENEQAEQKNLKRSGRKFTAVTSKRNSKCSKKSPPGTPWISPRPSPQLSRRTSQHSQAIPIARRTRSRTDLSNSPRTTQKWVSPRVSPRLSMAKNTWMLDEAEKLSPRSKSPMSSPRKNSRRSFNVSPRVKEFAYDKPLPPLPAPRKSHSRQGSWVVPKLRMSRASYSKPKKSNGNWDVAARSMENIHLEKSVTSSAPSSNVNSRRSSGILTESERQRRRKKTIADLKTEMQFGIGSPRRESNSLNTKTFGEGAEVTMGRLIAAGSPTKSVFF